MLATIILAILLAVCFLALIALSFFFVSEFVAIFTTDAPFVPVPRHALDAIIDNLELTENSVFYDLGCGDARVITHAIGKIPDMKSVGVEIAFLPYFISKFRTRRNKNIAIKREDIFRTNVSDATHIFVYLYPEVLTKLLPVLNEKCTPGTRIVSCDFECAGTTPHKIVNLDAPKERGKRLIVYFTRR